MTTARTNKEKGIVVYQICEILWFVLSTMISLAFAAESDNVGLGAGVATCRQFAEFRKLEYGPTMLHFTAWAHGFMSAMNLHTYESVGTFRELSPDVSFSTKLLSRFLR